MDTPSSDYGGAETPGFSRGEERPLASLYSGVVTRSTIG